VKDFLESINLFYNVKEDFLISVSSLCKTKQYPKSSMIILEEEYGDRLFIIKSGTVKITRVNDEGKEVIIALLGAGDFFGEMAILDGDSRSANALAQEKCELVTINKEDFLEMLRNNFQMCRNLLEELAVRLRKSDQQIEALSLSDAEHRIGVSLLNLAEDRGVIKNGEVTIESLPYQQDIANMAGTSRETVSRVLKLFEDRMIISKTGHTLKISDYKFFKRIFG
tara:strand:+ start:102 stop:776 length:675 start_codon:yes stop_codon:yes gene_type:complete